MVALPDYRDPTLEAADRALEQQSGTSKPRPYLGMSGIGHPCSRKLWYDFHWCTEIKFKAKTLKAFADGHYGEDLQAHRLQQVDGLTLSTHDPMSGMQYEVTDFGGHLRGHIDGAIHGLIQAPKTWHVWEHKQVNEAKQKKLEKLKQDAGEKQAFAKWDEIYYAQGVLYMHYTEMKRHYLTVSTPGGRHTISCRTNENKKDAKALLKKAEAIIFSDNPLDRISEKPDWYQCKWCDHQDICHFERVPQVNCRTCLHATVEQDGTWSCNAFKKTLTDQSCCANHLFIPSLIPFGRYQSYDNESDLPRWIEYKHTNGAAFYNIIETENNALHDNGFYSTELSAMKDHNVIGDDFVQDVRATFNAKVQP